MSAYLYVIPAAMLTWVAIVWSYLTAPLDTGLWKLEIE